MQQASLWLNYRITLQYKAIQFLYNKKGLVKVITFIFPEKSTIRWLFFHSYFAVPLSEYTECWSGSSCMILRNILTVDCVTVWTLGIHTSPYPPHHHTSEVTDNCGVTGTWWPGLLSLDCSYSTLRAHELLIRHVVRSNHDPHCSFGCLSITNSPQLSPHTLFGSSSRPTNSPECTILSLADRSHLSVTTPLPWSNIKSFLTIFAFPK